MMRFLAVTFAILVTGMAEAECVGRNLIAALTPAGRVALQAAVDAVPFAKGNLWHATKGPMHVTLIGTYHMDDPRHAAILAAIASDLTTAKALLVEAGPQEDAAMQAELAANPARLINHGPALPDSLTPADWTRLSAALTERGIPPDFAAQLQPWYVATLLAVPICQYGVMATARGLDRRLISLAMARGVPVMALEPYDTVLTLFDAVPAADQTDMLIETLSTTGPLEPDMQTTLADSYFAGDPRLFWEFSRQQALDLPGADPARIARQFALVEDVLMTRRNRAWAPVIEAQAARGHLIVAFGALHLSGETGVLNLLSQNGWRISPW